MGLDRIRTGIPIAFVSGSSRASRSALRLILIRSAHRSDRPGGICFATSPECLVFGVGSHTVAATFPAPFHYCSLSLPLQRLRREIKSLKSRNAKIRDRRTRSCRSSCLPWPRETGPQRLNNVIARWKCIFASRTGRIAGRKRERKRKRERRERSA